MLTVCASSTADWLVPPDELKDLLGIAGSTDDALIDALLRRASAAVETYVGYPLKCATYQECVKAYGTMNLMVSRTPIRSILRVFDATSTDTATEYTSTEVRVEDPDAGLLHLESGFAWTAGQNLGSAGEDYVVPGSELTPWLIEYAAGYQPLNTTSTAYGTTSTSADVPEDVQMAVLETAKSWYLSRRQDSDINSKRIGDLSVTYRMDRGAGGLPAGARVILQPWRRMA